MLLTAGCSFVWGDELEGFDQNPPAHWDKTWTSILSKKMNMDYVNLGICGSSNDRIFRAVTDHLHNPELENPTHMVVIWSAWQRAEVVEYMRMSRENVVGLNRPENATQYSPVRTATIGTKKKRDSLAAYFNDAYDSRTDIMHDLTKMKSMEVICDALGIKLIQGVFHYRSWGNVLAVLKVTDPSNDMPDSEVGFIGDTPRYDEWVKNALGSLRPRSRYGLGKGPCMYSVAKKLNDVKEFGHPGEKTQHVWSDLMLAEFNKIET